MKRAVELWPERNHPPDVVGGCALLPQQPKSGGAVRFGKLAAIAIEHERVMIINWRGQAEVLNSGVPSKGDPQSGVLKAFPPAHVDHVITDGQMIRIGNVAVTAAFTNYTT